MSVNNLISDLKSEKPMNEEEVVKAVLTQRKVKESTIIFNLKRSPEFIKTKEGYLLAKPLKVSPKPVEEARG